MSSLTEPMAYGPQQYVRPRRFAIPTTANGGRLLVASTICARDQTGELPILDAARIFVLDARSGQARREFVPVLRATTSGAVAGVGGPFILGLTYDPDDRRDSLPPTRTRTSRRTR